MAVLWPVLPHSVTLPTSLAHSTAGPVPPVMRARDAWAVAGMMALSLWKKPSAAIVPVLVLTTASLALACSALFAVRYGVTTRVTSCAIVREG